MAICTVRFRESLGVPADPEGSFAVGKAVYPSPRTNLNGFHFDNLDPDDEAALELLLNRVIRGPVR